MICHGSHDCESKLAVLYHQCLVLCQRQMVCGASEPKVIKHVVDLIDVLFVVARMEEPGGGGGWSILGIMGLAASYKPTPRAKFLAISLAYFLLRQIATGPHLRTIGGR